MTTYAKKLASLSPEQYLPRTGNVAQVNLAWSVSLNLALWLKMTSEFVQPVGLYVEYNDSRGKQVLPVDNQLLTQEDEILFSNLVKLPIKGSINEVELVVMYKDQQTDFEVEELFVRVIESPETDPRLYKTA